MDRNYQILAETLAAISNEVRLIKERVDKLEKIHEFTLKTIENAARDVSRLSPNG